MIKILKQLTNIKKQEEEENMRKAKQLKLRTQKILGKTTRVIKSILAILLIIITINMAIITNKVNAVTNTISGISELELYSKQNLFCFKYRGILCRSEFVVYNYNGKEYPAYCLNRELEGVSLKSGGYKVSIEKLISNELVWRAIINGYPYKTYQELGCANEMEAFTATKLAAYNMMYNYNLEEFIPVNDVGERVVDAIKNISNIARNSNQTKINAEVKIKSDENQWSVDKIDKNYISKVYKISVNSEISNYIVNLNNSLKGIRITDLKNKDKNEFNNLEDFKVLIPIEQLKSETQKFEILVNSKVKTYPIYYGKAPNNLQNYAISGIEYEEVSNNYIDEIPQNKTSLKIEKIDAKTKEPLSDFEFSIINNQNKIIQKFKTNNKGIIELKGILPGKYTIIEENGTNEYIIKKEPIIVEISFGQEYKTVVENDKKIVEKPQQEITKEIVKLPRTGF